MPIDDPRECASRVAPVAALEPSIARAR